MKPGELVKLHEDAVSGYIWNDINYTTAKDAVGQVEPDELLLVITIVKNWRPSMTLVYSPGLQRWGWKRSDNLRRA